MLVREPLKTCRAFSRRRAREQVCFCGELRIDRVEVSEGGDFRFPDEAAGEDSGVRCRRQGEAAITDRQPEIVNSDRKVKHPRGPKLPARAAAQCNANAAAKVPLTQLA